MAKVVITGVTGMDGSLMADYLLDLGHEVYGVARYSASPNLSNLEKARDHDNFELVSGDLTDEVSINKVVREVAPDYFVNFAAHSFVGDSWEHPMRCFDVNTEGVMRCLEAIRHHAPGCRFYNAGSSEEFGDVQYSPQDEKHPLRPRSPYGASKAAARHAVKVWRDSYDMFAVQGWLFNHEGPRRGESFVTRKITKAVANIYARAYSGEPFEPVVLGNLEARRDWSDAEDMVRAVWLMLNNDKPEEYVVASGETHSIREFVSRAFQEAELPLQKTPSRQLDEDRTAVYSLDGKPAVAISREFYRPAEVDLLLGDASRIRDELGWRPGTTFGELVSKMVKNDIKLAWKKSK